MIATFTINPALDKSTSVSRVIAEQKLRCKPMLIEAGGGGINVSKAIHELGGSALAIFPGGGNNGRLLEEILKKSGVQCRSMPVSSETREDFSVTETDTNAQYRFVLPGASLGSNELSGMLALVSGMQPFPDYMVVSGSLPPGTPVDFYAKVASICKAKGCKCIVDTSGDPLLQAAKEGVYLLKPNLSELSSLCGVDSLEADEVAAAASKIVNDGYCEIAVISLGPAGALLVTINETIRVTAPVVKKLSTVGAGDSMVGGMVWMLERGATLKETIRFGVACGTAATMNPGTSLFKKDDAWRLYNWLCVQN